jgi:cell division transport system permease protein
MRASFVMSGVATGIKRNLSMTVALILNTAIALSFAGGALLVSRFIDKFQSQYTDKLNVSIYLCGDVIGTGSTCKQAVTPTQITSLQTQLTADPRVKSYQYLDTNASYALAKKTLPADESAELTPGVIPALFVLKLRDINKDYAGIQKDYAQVAGVDLIQNQSLSLKTLLDIFDKARIGAGVAAIAIMICALILMANAIQVAANQRRAETGIMRLVGASRWMTQLPFMIEAVLAALAGSVLAIVLIGVGKKFFLDSIFRRQVDSGVLPSLSLNDVLVAGGVGAAAGVVLAAITAYITLRALVRL